jgi:hypothetical protein
MMSSKDMMLYILYANTYSLSELRHFLHFFSHFFFSSPFLDLHFFRHFFLLLLLLPPLPPLPDDSAGAVVSSAAVVGAGVDELSASPLHKNVISSPSQVHNFPL